MWPDDHGPAGGLAWLRVLLDERRAAHASIAAALARGEVEWTNTRGLWAAVTPGMGGRRWRVTRFDALGPVGHYETDDPAEELVDLGCTTPGAGGIDELARGWPRGAREQNAQTDREASDG